jgi:hypothetical protein
MAWAFAPCASPRALKWSGPFTYDDSASHEEVATIVMANAA